MRRGVDACRLPRSISARATAGADGRRYVFTWNRSRFPDPEGLQRDLPALGYRTVANVKPNLLTEHPDYAELAEAGAFVHRDDGTPSTAQFWGGTGAALDFTSASARRFWRERLTRDVLRVGFDGVWNDNNEMELVDDGARLAGDGRPLPAMDVRPLLALLMTRESDAALRAERPDAAPYCISRAGPLGIGAVAETWSGDNFTSWHTLRWNLAQSLSMSLSGMPLVGHDIRGLHGAAAGRGVAAALVPVHGAAPAGRHEFLEHRRWRRQRRGCTQRSRTKCAQASNSLPLPADARSAPLQRHLRAGHPLIAVYWWPDTPFEAAPTSFMLGPDRARRARGRGRRARRFRPHARRRELDRFRHRCGLRGRRRGRTARPARSTAHPGARRRGAPACGCLR